MHLISRHPRLSEFWAKYPDAQTPLLAWAHLVESSDWKTFADVRRQYGHADQVGAFTVFNIGGNKYRLVVKIAFPKGKVYVHRVMTHREYDDGDWKTE